MDKLLKLKKGDIIFEANGGFGIIGHIAIVEGKYWSSAFNTYYIRLVEAIEIGVVRSILDDERIDDKGVTVLRPDTTSKKIQNAVRFCVSQLGKAYSLDFTRDTDATEKDWYCSELVWAGFKNQGINLETTGLYNELGITPRDIKKGKHTTVISYA